MIELLFVLAILGTVVAVVYNFYFSGLGTWQRGLDRMDYQQSARIAVDKIIEELRFAHWIEIKAGGQEIDFGFKVEGEIHTFKRVGPDNEDLVYIYPYEGGTQQSKVALGITEMHFTVDERKNVHVTIRAGKSAGSITMESSVRPRNIP